MTQPTRPHQATRRLAPSRGSSLASTSKPMVMPRSHCPCATVRGQSDVPVSLRDVRDITDWQWIPHQGPLGPQAGSRSAPFGPLTPPSHPPAPTDRRRQRELSASQPPLFEVVYGLGRRSPIWDTASASIEAKPGMTSGLLKTARSSDPPLAATLDAMASAS